MNKMFCGKTFAATALVFSALMLAGGCSDKDADEADKPGLGGYIVTETFVDDRDGQSYKRVKIGGQWWMTENLNYDAAGSVCYDNSDDNCDTYGRLYDLSAAQEACPRGFHLPGDAEWDTLVSYAGGSQEAGQALKFTTGWDGKNGNDKYGFSALSGGYGYEGSDGDAFDYIGSRGYWWSATKSDTSGAWDRHMDNHSWTVYRNLHAGAFMLSVRCVGDATVTVTFNANGGVVSPLSVEIYAGGTLASLPKPTKTGYAFDGWYTAATGGTKVTASTVFTENAAVYAQWSVPPYSITDFVDSRDGQTYHKIVLGGQTWMAENLNYAGSDSSVGVCYDNSNDNCDQYGRLYGWSVALTVCPADFHLPSDMEWTTLRDFAGGTSTAGIRLKSETGWNNDGNGTDDYGFSALPGGHGGTDGSFDEVGDRAYWWSATEDYEGYFSWYWFMYSGTESLGRSSASGSESYFLYSVRCVED